MKQSLKEKSYEYIKNKIVTCEYMPGDFLDEKSLIDEIGASRTPIREALNKLEQENLIQIIPKKGVIVKNLSIKDVMDVYQLRILIEPNAILQFSDKIDMDIIKQLQTEASTMSTVEEIDLHDDKVHQYFISLYDNQYISNIVVTFKTQNHRIRLLSTQKTSQCANITFDEHSAIFEAILNKDFELASKKLEEHILSSRERTLESLLQTL